MSKYKNYSSAAVLQLNSSTEYQDEKRLQSTDHSAYLHFTVFVTTVQQQQLKLTQTMRDLLLVNTF